MAHKKAGGSSRNGRDSAGRRLGVKKFGGEAGDSVAFDQVLLVGEDEKTTTGAPFVAGASVTAEVVEQTRGDKIIVFKKKRRKKYRRKQGHRQRYTDVQVESIL